MDDVYHALREHLDSLPAGFPSTESGVEIRILKRLFTPAEAGLAVHLRPKLEPAAVIAEVNDITKTAHKYYTLPQTFFDIMNKQDIQEMVERLQAGAEKAVSVMNQSQSQAKDSVEQAALANDSLASIAAMIAQINDMNMQIAAAAEEQSAVAEEINKNVISISQISTQTAQGANETSAASNTMKTLASESFLLFSALLPPPPHG